METWYQAHSRTIHTQGYFLSKHFRRPISEQEMFLAGSKQNPSSSQPQGTAPCIYVLNHDQLFGWMASAACHGWEKVTGTFAVTSECHSMLESHSDFSIQASRATPSNPNSIYCFGLAGMGQSRGEKQKHSTSSVFLPYFNTITDNCPTCLSKKAKVAPSQTFKNHLKKKTRTRTHPPTNSSTHKHTNVTI